MLDLHAEIGEKAGVEELEFENVLTLFDESLRAHLSPILGSDCVRIEWKGKYDKRKFRAASIRVKGLGGSWVKGHFLIPLENIGIEPRDE